jgi:uncharacterized protein with NRDE domain
MCTVTYIPVANGCWLTSNRDEVPHRQPATTAGWHILANGDEWYFAKDAKAGGTWMATHKNVETAILLNGAGKPFVPLDKYKLSRGLVLLQLLQMQEPLPFAFLAYDLTGIAPFTLVHFRQGQLHECKWDSVEMTVKRLDEAQAFIWSSSTLYSEVIRKKRQQWFDEWQTANPNPDWDAIMGFHGSQNENDPENSICMKRKEGIQTISISSVQLDKQRPVFFHHDVLATQLMHP